MQIWKGKAKPLSPHILRDRTGLHLEDRSRTALHDSV